MSGEPEERPPTDPDPTSLPWIRSLQEGGGTESIWEALHTRYLRRLVVYASLQLGPRLRRLHDPDDVVNEAWRRVYARFDSFEYRGADSMFRWLCLEIRRVTAELGRRRTPHSTTERAGARSSLFELEDAADPRTGPGTNVMRRDLLENLVQSLESLPGPYRDVLEALLLKGMSREEVAREQGLRPNTVSKKKERALALWAQALEADPMTWL